MNFCISSGFFADIFKIFSDLDYLGMILEGFKQTLIISVGASVLGLILGSIVAMVKIAPQNKITTVLKAICGVYTTVIRGTPMALQLFIMAFVVFAIRGFPQLVVAILAFGINSGAYVSESIRAGLLAVDKGQTEAGRALGLKESHVLINIVIPQAMKTMVPTIGNEFIALIKETSIVGMIGMYDLTQVSKILAGGQYLASYLAPTTVVALFYLALVYLVTLVIKIIERRVRQSDKR